MGFPNEFAKYVNYTRSLQYEEDPKYYYLKDLFTQVLSRDGFRIDCFYDWDNETIFYFRDFRNVDSSDNNKINKSKTDSSTLSTNQQYNNRDINSHISKGDNRFNYNKVNYLYNNSNINTNTVTNTGNNNRIGVNIPVNRYEESKVNDKSKEPESLYANEIVKEYINNEQKLKNNKLNQNNLYKDINHNNNLSTNLLNNYQKNTNNNNNINTNLSNNYQNNNNNNNNNNNKEEITNNFNNRKSSDYAVLTFEDLKEKSALIKLNRKSLFNYNAKLTSKLNFYKIQFDLFHKKELELEDLRSILNQRASKIIEENFLSFKQLVKINPGIKEFIKKNKDFIEQVKNQNKKEKLKEMNKKINETNPVNNQEKTEIISNETEDKNDEYELNLQFMNNMQVLIHSIQKLIMINKDFFMKCSEHFKLIKSSLELIADFEKKEFEKNDNNDKNNLNKVNFKDKGETNDNIQIFQDVIKIISDEDSELDILINKMNQKNLNDKNNLLNYIKNLINFVQTDDELKNIFDIDKLNTDLLYNFYKDVDTQRIKTSFYKQFKLKRFPILDSEFNHFTTISNDLTAQIKKISKIVSDLEQNEKLNKLYLIDLKLYLYQHKKTHLILN